MPSVRALLISFSALAAMTGCAQDAPAQAQGKEGIEPQLVAGSIEKIAPGEQGLALGIHDVWVWLPPSYGENPDRRYPVLYMHDGQNLFDRRLTNYDKAWQMDEAVARMAAQGDLREWIIVGLRSPVKRYLTLFPEKLADHLPPERFAWLASAADDGVINRDLLKGDEYLAYLTGTIKAQVDANYRTLSGPEDTAVMGSSMGALISLYAIAEYPDVFGQAAALSLHLPLGDPEVDDLDAYVADVTEAWRVYLATTALEPGKNRLYLDHGTATLDQFYAPYFAAMDAMMAQNGWSGSAYMSRQFTGAEHDEVAWHERIEIPLAFLDRNDP